jgi:hypothetical protein
VNHVQDNEVVKKDNEEEMMIVIASIEENKKKIKEIKEIKNKKDKEVDDFILYTFIISFSVSYLFLYLIPRNRNNGIL